MAAYATPRLTLASNRTASDAKAANLDADGSMLDAVIDRLADRVAQRLAIVLERGTPAEASDNEWLDSRHAADYLGIHRDTLRKLAAERAIPSEQDGPNCKLYFRRSDLGWRRSGGRPRHLTTTLQRVA